MKDVPAVADLYNGDYNLCSVNLINDPVVPYANAVYILVILQFSATVGPWILRQERNRPQNADLVFPVYLLKLPFSCGRDLYFIFRHLIPDHESLLPGDGQFPGGSS